MSPSVAREPRRGWPVISRLLVAYARAHDRPGYPWHVRLADVLTGWARRIGL